METYRLGDREEAQMDQMSFTYIQAGEAGKIILINRSKKTLQFTLSTQKKDMQVGITLCLVRSP